MCCGTKIKKRKLRCVIDIGKLTKHINESNMNGQVEEM